MPRPDNWPRTILHVDLDAFYTSVHQRDDPKLRGVPVAVAGRSRRAVVMGASYEARAYGVRSAMPLHEALQLCPQLTVIAPDSARYREASRLVGLYYEGRQVGFCRAHTDGNSYVYLADVYVLDEFRGRGLGEELVREMVERGPYADLRWLLHTTDMHSLYRKLGFAEPDVKLMERPAR